MMFGILGSNEPAIVEQTLVSAFRIKIRFAHPAEPRRCLDEADAHSGADEEEQ
jgi:hypothetical protein